MDYELIKTTQGIIDSLKYLQNSVAAGLDIETTALQPRHGEISLIQLSDGVKVFIIDCIELDGRYLRGVISSLSIDDAAKFWKSYKQAESLQLLIPFLESERPRKVVQNLKFEATWFQEKLGCEINGAFDTYLAGKLLDMPSDCKLDTLLEKYLSIAVSKEEQKSNWSGKLTKEQMEYAARDAFHLPALREKQIYFLKQAGMIEVAAIEFNAVRTVAKMESVGFPVNKEMYKDLVDELIIRRDVRARELEEVLNDAMGYEIVTQVQGSFFGDDTIITTGGVNLNSPSQVKEAFLKLGVPLESTNKQTVNTMVTKYPQLKYLTDYRAEQILVTAFGEKIINIIDKETGRIHASFWQLKPATGRFAASNPNLQQMPHTKEFRQCFRPLDPNRVFVICVDKNTRISTDNGLVRIKDIAIDSLAVQENKELQKIERILPKGIQHAKKIILVGGYELTATDSHQLRAVDNNGNYVWKKVKDIADSDYVALVGNTIQESIPYISLPTPENGHYKERVLNLSTSVLDEELSEFLGYLCGDGSFYPNQTKWVVNDQDKDVRAYLHNYVTNLTSLPVGTREYRGVFESYICSTYFSKLLDKLDISKDYVSDFIFKSRRSVVASFLRGLFEADGCITNGKSGCVSYASSREQIVTDVQNLLLGLGIFSHKRTCIYNLKGKKFVGYQLTIKGQSLPTFKELIGFISSRKKNKLSNLVLTDKSHRLGFPNLRNKFKNYSFGRDARSAYKSIKSDNRQLSLKYAETLKVEYPDIFEACEVYRLTDYNQIFLPIQSTEDVEAEVFDLTISETSTYIGNGFVNHNCDYSGIELRILAQISQDPVMIDAFNNNRDLHSITAIAAFNLPCSEKEVKTLYPEQRGHAKGLNFGVVYGIGANKYADNVGISPAEAKKAIRGFYDTYKGVEKYLYAIEDFGIKNRHVKTLAGRKLQLYFDPTSEKEIGMAKRNARNYPIQGTSADILKLALGLLYPRLMPFKNAYVVNIVHDEIIIECDRKDGDAIKEILSESMLEAAYKYLPDIYVEAEANISEDWSEK